MIYDTYTSHFKALCGSSPKVTLTFLSCITPVLVPPLNSLSQPVTSQAENNEPLKGLYMGFIRERTIEFTLFRMSLFNLFLENDLTVSYPTPISG